MKLVHRKLLVGAGSVAAAAGLLVLLVILPVAGYQNSLAKELRAAQSQKVGLLIMERRYQAAKEAQERYSREFRTRDPNFTLFAFMENLAAKDQVRPNIEFIRPSVKKIDDNRQEEIVDLRLSDLALDKLATYLYHIETAPEIVKVKRFILRTHKDKALDVDLVLSTLTKGKPTT